MTENEKRYEDFAQALNELCLSHGLWLGVYDESDMAIWDNQDSNTGIIGRLKNQLSE